MATPAVSAELGTALTVWNDKDHEFYYPVAAGATVPGYQAITYNNLIGRAWDHTTANNHLDTMGPAIKKTYKNKEPGKFPLQKKLAGLTVPQTILSNHFELKVHDTTLYEYEILDLEHEGQTWKKTQALFRKAIAQWAFLMNDQASFATDGQKTIVSWKPLHASMNSSKLVPSTAGPYGVGSIWEEDISTGRATSFTARIKYAGPVNIPDLMAQTRCDLSKVNADLSAVERCINILISKSFNNSVIKASGKKFYVRSARNDLMTSQSLEIIRGYYYAVQPSIGSLLLNFNVATSAFFKPILVSEFLSDGQTFGSPTQRVSLLKRLRVYVEYQHSEERLNKMGSRLKMIHALGDAETERIETLYFHKKLMGADGKSYKLPNGDWARETARTMVVKHHKDVFGLDVQTGRPAVNVGSSADPVWYAQEALRIVPYQMYTRPVPDHLTGAMVDQAAYHPRQSQWLIEHEGLSQLGFNVIQDNAVQMRNGVPLSLYPTMLKVPSERLPFPSVQYAANTRNKGREAPKPKKQSGWNLQDFEAFVTVKATSLKYFVIHDLPASSASNVVDNFCQEIKNQMGLRLQMSAQNVTCLNPNGVPARLNGGNLESLVKQAKSLGADLVVLILPSPNRLVYAEFKTLADKEYGLHSLCVAKPAELDPARRVKYMTNIAQKINIKFNGVNSRVDEVIKYLGNDTIVLGADVIHPGPTALPDAPSIACMVGSVDPYGGKFLGSTRLQSKDKKDREIIDNVKEMVLERLSDWKRIAGSAAAWPMNVISTAMAYLKVRNITTRQYGQVLNVEVKAIRAAHAEFLEKNRYTALGGKKLMLTAMVGVKRHHTRFYPMNAADADVRGNNNCHPGTWVDRGVTSPYFRDFYLQSHSGIKGTARPTHYFTLVNGLIKSCRGTEELRKLTHLLCYTYCRATTGVSYATPTYYADRLCDRVRLYLPNTWTGGDINFETQLNSAQNTVLHGRQHARDVIYRNGQAFDAQAGHVKTDAEKADEAGDTEAVRLAARQVVLEYAQQEFYSARQADANAIASAANPTAVAPRITTGNPWHDNVAKTMFWM